MPPTFELCINGIVGAVFFCFWLLCPTLHVRFIHIVCSFRYSLSWLHNIPGYESSPICLSIILLRISAASRGGDYEQHSYAHSVIYNLVHIAHIYSYSESIFKSEVSESWCMHFVDFARQFWKAVVPFLNSQQTYTSILTNIWYCPCFSSSPFCGCEVVSLNLHLPGD